MNVTAAKGLAALRDELNYLYFIAAGDTIIVHCQLYITKKLCTGDY